MPGFIKRGDQTLLVDARNDAVHRVLAGRVDDGEVLAEVAENGPEETECVGGDEVDALLVTVVADGYLDVEGCVGEDDNLVLVELREVLAETAWTDPLAHACSG
jgi:hypothetical protein